MKVVKRSRSAQLPRFSQCLSHAWQKSMRPGLFDLAGFIAGGVVTAWIEGTMNRVAVFAAVASGLTVSGMRFATHLWRTPLEIAGEDQIAIQDAYEKAVADRDDAQRAMAALSSKTPDTNAPSAEVVKAVARANQDFIASLLQDVRRTLEPVSGSGMIRATTLGPEAMRACREQVCAQVRNRFGGAAAERVAGGDAELEAYGHLSSASAVAFAYEQQRLRRTRENLTYLLDHLDLYS